MLKKLILAILFLALSIGIFVFVVLQRSGIEVENTANSKGNSIIYPPQEQEDDKTIIEDIHPVEVSDPLLEKSSLPTSYLIPGIAFTPQAPHADWSMPFEEACEETSTLIVHAFYEELTLDADFVSNWIHDSVSWQEEYFGSHKDLSSYEVAEFAEKYLGYTDVEVYEDITIENLKNFISHGYPVIIPTAGRELHNPYFTAPGPYYHMLVIIGYTEDQFVTHDPGTKRGQNYLYDQDILYNAIHDWNNGEVISGRKNVIIIFKE